MQWVKIEDSLPPIDEPVDIWLDDGYEHHARRQYDCWRQAHKNGDGWIWMRKGYNAEVVVRDQHNVTHWLKIEAPQ